MGRDKAMLPFGGRPLAAHVASVVRDAAGSATLVGDPARHAGLGFELISDLLPGCGPLGGIHAALRHSRSEWNLIVACDMPGLSVPLLRELLEAAAGGSAGVLLPAAAPGRPEPLCGVWRRDVADGLEEALARGVRKVAEAAAGLGMALWPVGRVDHFANVNTPEEWAGYAPR
jgi:molybdopterin-guanine dinucleotide biosynthesis protein A